MKRDKIRLKSRNKRSIIVVALIVILIVILAIYSKNRNKTSNILSRVSKYVEVKDSSINVNFKVLKKINKDLVACMKIEDSDALYPIVKSKDNNYYLNHNFYRNKNKEGWLFADCNSLVDGLDKNLIIYGNNKEENSMIGNIIKTLNSKLYKDNIFITIVKENENIKYQVFSVYQVKSDIYYTKTDFNSTSFLNFINIIKKRSIRDFKVEVDGNDNVLTLATCNNDDKYIVVIHAKKCK